MSEDLFRLTAAEARRRMKEGMLTATALTEACLGRIDQREDRIGAWVEVGRDQALIQAQVADRNGLAGPLAGVTVGVKDVIDALPFHTRFGSSIFRDNMAAADAACVAMLRKAGAVILGKTETTEFAAFKPSRTRNPVNPDHTPGGSSAGSAAAVADCHVQIALGTQTAASTSRPAAFCGTFAYKPTVNAVSTEGILHTSDTLDTLGIFARGVADLALVHEAYFGRPPETANGRVRVGLWEGPGKEAWDPRVRAFLAKVGDVLQAKGLLTGVIELGPRFEEGIEHQKAIYAWELARQLGPKVAGHDDAISASLKGFLEEGMALAESDYRAALSGRASLQQAFPEVLGNVDALVVAGAPIPAPHGFSTTGDPTCGRLWTLLGVPTISIPAGRTAEGLPLGIQVVGRAGQDAALFPVAEQVAQAVGSIQL
jgi:Asp-tRNA(Asn)/Glu-tRNA(Gln) amidotransferase A subunit family amidase